MTFSEPVCWNCKKAKRIPGFVNAYVCCENYETGIDCEYEPASIEAIKGMKV